MKKYWSLILGVLLCSSCGKFLEEFSQDLAYAENCADLDEILIGNGYMESDLSANKMVHDGYYAYIHVMDDDIDMTKFDDEKGSSNTVISFKNFYDWSNQLMLNPYSGDKWEDRDWERLYAHIGYLNVIIDRVKNFTRDSIQFRNKIEGEAYFLRGGYYYLLTNLYANPYVKETASKDFGVPLNLTEKIEDKYFSRNSMEECYHVIVEDLKVAAEKLKGIKQPLFYRANELAARILLSRVYLYMGEWQLALDECEKAMALDGSALLDLNQYGEIDEDGNINYDGKMILDSRNPEIVFTQGSSTDYGYGNIGYTNTCAFAFSRELVSLYNLYSSQGIVDLRPSLIMTSHGGSVLINKGLRFTNRKVFDCFVIRSAEIYLNKAEAEAMLDKTAEAVSTIKSLLFNRFLEGRIPSIDGLKGKELVSFIREERRRELCFEAHRWFDLRRYAVCSKYPEKKSIRHITYDKEGVLEGSYVLHPYGEDPAWVLPIPGYEIEFNQGAMINNPERTSRKLQ